MRNNFANAVVRDGRFCCNSPPVTVTVTVCRAEGKTALPVYQYQARLGGIHARPVIRTETPLQPGETVWLSDGGHYDGRYRVTRVVKTHAPALLPIVYLTKEDHGTPLP